MGFSQGQQGPLQGELRVGLGCAALGVQDIGLPQGAIGGELAGAAVDERAAGHHQLTGVTRHRCGDRIEIGAHG